MHGILIVEDEPIIRFDLESIVRGAGYPVVGTAHDTLSALTVATLKRPSVVLLDLDLDGSGGGLHGIHIAKELRQHFRTKIIFVTAHRREDVARACAIKPAAFVQKPFMPLDVISAINEAVPTGTFALA